MLDTPLDCCAHLFVNLLLDWHWQITNILLIITQFVLHIRYLALLGCSLGSSTFSLRFISTILSYLSLSTTALASF